MQPHFHLINGDAAAAAFDIKPKPRTLAFRFPFAARHATILMLTTWPKKEID
jgi:hypothetical protein